MPWRVEGMESQKQKFIRLWELGRFTKTSLCQDFGISRPTGDAIIKRYLEEGWDALNEHSRRHSAHPFTTAPAIEEAIVQLRNQYRYWGARKIRHLLNRNPDIPNSLIPSETTVNNIMKKHGLVVPRKKGRRRLENQYPRFDPEKPNEIWSADFKGKFRMGNREYCNPLTVADSKSRFLFAISGLERADGESCKPILERIFREYGLPEYFHTDNGAPFGNAVSFRRMTRLSVWLMEIGIIPVYSDPASPQQNGRHERMHRDLKAEATRPPGRNLREQQKKFDSFRETYNTIRPHEALQMLTPAEVHVRSKREYPLIIRDWDYPSGLKAKMVTVNGAMRWGKNFVMISTALSGKYVGLEELEDGIWGVYYRQVPLGYFGERSMQIYELTGFNL